VEENVSTLTLIKFERNLNCDKHTTNLHVGNQTLLNGRKACVLPPTHSIFV